jgi:hypothetical protein
MVLSYIHKHFPRTLRVLGILGILWFLFLPFHVHSQPQETIGKNTVFTDMNLPLLSLFYYPTGIKGFGLELGYERTVSKNFALMLDAKHLRLSSANTHFYIWDIGLYGRYVLWRTGSSAFLTSVKLGTLLYDSPYFQGGTFMIGIDISWKYHIFKHVVLEPYISCTVSADDRHIMPFASTALTELLIPGFNAGLRAGFAF